MASHPAWERLYLSWLPQLGHSDRSTPYKNLTVRDVVGSMHNSCFCAILGYTVQWCSGKIVVECWCTGQCHGRNVP